MKKILLVFTALCVNFTLCLAADHGCDFDQYTYNNVITSIIVQNSDYVPCIIKTWNINVNAPVHLKFTYDVDLNPLNAMDYISIYAVDDSGNRIGNNLLNYAYQPMSGELITPNATGRAQVVLYSEYGSAGTYTGISISFAPYSVTSGDQLFDGKVGIGILPQEKLHINGYVRGDGINGSLRIRTTTGTTEIGSTNTQYSHFYTDRSGFLFMKPIRISGGNISGYGSGTSNKLNFITQDTVRMIVTNTGYIGVGTTNPQDRLSVDNGGLKIGNSSDSNARARNVLRFGDGDYVKIGEWEENNQMAFKATSFNFTNGNVGIGVTNPSYKLDVNGAMYLRHSGIVDGWYETYLYWEGHNLVLGSPAGRYMHNSVDLRPGGFDGSSLYSQLRMYTANGTTNQILRIQLNTNNNCWFNNTGNFGIGTDSPIAKLDVRGTIRASEVVVYDPSTADFVFDTSYNLPSLEQVSSYVKENHHLPDIQSAEEMKENGVSMSELQIKLLQKIEELTLYLIQQEETIKQLNERVNELEK